MLLLVVAACFAATPFNRTHFHTNSIHHVHEVAYPLERIGHHRRSLASTVFECVSSSLSPRGVGTCNRNALLPRMYTSGLMEQKIKAHRACVAAHRCPIHRSAISNQPCVNGKSGQYTCLGIDLQSFVPIASLGSTMDASDIWGWTDSTTGDEIAIISFMDGTSFVQ